jgi:hypothetical protein
MSPSMNRAQVFKIASTFRLGSVTESVAVSYFTSPQAVRGPALESRNRPGVAQRVPGDLGSQIQ